MEEHTGSPEDLERLMEEHGDRILRLCALCLRDAALAEDAAQETMLRAWRGYGSYRGDAAERTWLTAIAVNVCRSMLRSPWHTRRAGAEVLERAAVEDAYRDDTLARAVLALPEKYRTAVALYYYQQLSTRETARALGLPERTVSTRLRRAREKLKDMLKEWYYDEA